LKWFQKTEIWEVSVKFLDHGPKGRYFQGHSGGKTSIYVLFRPIFSFHGGCFSRTKWGWSWWKNTEKKIIFSLGRQFGRYWINSLWTISCYSGLQLLVLCF